MKNTINYLTLLMVGALLVFQACQKSERACIDSDTEIVTNAENNGMIIPGKYIVRFNDNVIPQNKLKVSMTYDQRNELVSGVAYDLEEQITGTVGAIDYTYTTVFEGFAGSLTEEQVNKLLQDPRIKSIEPDRIVSLGKPDKPGKPGGGSEDPPQALEVTPWGISRVNGGGTYAGNGKAWIIDSGIDMDHPDLNVDAQNSKSFLSGKNKNNPDDENGHGTHVSGTIAAIDNEIGVVGVAAGATVVSVRVLDRSGSGAYSGVIAGVDYVGVNASSGDVANMSLGGPASSSLDNAVAAASTYNGKNIYFALAAGNEDEDANLHSPARTNGTNIYTVSAMTSSDNFASFSNFGSSVDYCEPGVSIYSCWENAGYKTISGTSMAAPHMAGILLMNGGSTPYSDSYVNGDPDGNADPIGELN